jgi:hypothetical protein
MYLPQISVFQVPPEPILAQYKVLVISVIITGI